MLRDLSPLAFSIWLYYMNLNRITIREWQVECFKICFQNDYFLEGARSLCPAPQNSWLWSMDSVRLERKLFIFFLYSVCAALMASIHSFRSDVLLGKYEGLTHNKKSRSKQYLQYLVSTVKLENLLETQNTVDSSSPGPVTLITSLSGTMLLWSYVSLELSSPRCPL